jgi:hypothetical protein
MYEEKPSRRGFLRGLVLAASGLVVGVTRPSFGSIKPPASFIGHSWPAARRSATTHSIEANILPIKLTHLEHNME